MLANILQLLLHARCASDDGRRVLLDQLLRENRSLLLDVVPLLGVLRNLSVLVHPTRHVLLTLHLNIAVLVGSLSILLEHDELLHLLELVHRRTIAPLFQVL